MKTAARIIAKLAAVFLCVSPALSAEPASGWRGNATGLWPDAKPPLVWHRTPRGALDGLRSRADRPTSADHGDAPLVEKGLLREWLVLGPLPVEDPVRQLDEDAFKGEATVEPSAGGVHGSLMWQKIAAPYDDPLVFGTAELPWFDLAKVVGFQRNQIAMRMPGCTRPAAGRHVPFWTMHTA